MDTAYYVFDASELVVIKIFNGNSFVSKLVSDLVVRNIQMRTNGLL